MYTLKSIVQRSALIGVTASMVAATLIPAASVLADALNPLTERSLLLSSSAPGFQDTDGAGNSLTNPNAIGENYAPAGSGPNGRKTGETFSFKVSTDSTSRPIQGFTLQYCTQAAGNCQAPGNNQGDERTTSRETNAVAHPLGRSDLEILSGFTQGVGAGQFQVYVEGVASTETWTMAVSNKEDTAHSGDLSGKNNFITLTSATGETPADGEKIEIIFRPSETVYITNPGSGAFFVKMNTYDSDATIDHVPGGASNIDGGVTVANVMTDSIHITTKVLETMAFSVGVHNRDTDELVNPAKHGTCDAIQVDPLTRNQLDLGNPDAEFSLETGRAWDVNSYWRLQSNSSGGATVYYSGDTLRNTVGDHIEAIGPTATLSNPGTEQFGLAFVDDSEMVDELSTSFEAEVLADSDNYKNPSILPLIKETDYDGGSGEIWAGPDSENPVPITAEFAFDENSLTTPVVIAQNNDAVLSCATGKMRYIGNIAADTPAGVYTTKINYLAAPQY